jgi:hypothetical protein
MVDCKIPRVNVTGPKGRQIITAWVYVCIGRKENTGCLPQMARLAGCLDVHAAEQLRTELADAKRAQTLAETQVSVMQERVRSALNTPVGMPEPQLPNHPPTSVGVYSDFLRRESVEVS